MRILHTMIRVGNLERSIAFYTEVLGMQLLRRNDYPEGRFTLAFVGYGEESDTAVIELTYNWGVDKYDLGSAYGHIALSVDNAAEACERIRQNGGNVTREAGPCYHRIIERFGELTGNSVVLNTSFNLHGYPIVTGAVDAVDVLLRSGLDCLVVEDTLIRKSVRAA